ncbi:MAG: glycosyltransferase family 2 protein [Verrucomicrobiae bacterium]|nr:glycosyltransferase family 2 protein [Verrucomicrobiae bacterium]
MPETPQSTGFAPCLSVVAPVYNEAGNVPRLADEVSRALADYPSDWELILVDDGSTDDTAAEIARAAAANAAIRPIRLRRNFGQTAALSAGIDASRGDVIVTLDADLQNDPADIPALLAKMAEGYDVVSGWRSRRKDDFVSRTLPSRIANWIISRNTGLDLHDFGCSLKAYDRDVLRSFRLYGEMHRFLPALCTWRGARVAEIPVNHRPRTIGASKYGIGRTTRVILDLLTVKFLIEYSTKPMRVFGGWGLLFGGAGLGLCIYLTWHKLVLHENIGGRPLLAFAVLLVIVGIQLLMLGLLSELLARIYFESQGKPVYELAKPAQAPRRRFRAD